MDTLLSVIILSDSTCTVMYKVITHVIADTIALRTKYCALHKQNSLSLGPMSSQVGWGWVMAEQQ